MKQKQNIKYKEYIFQALLIVFSVLFALFLDEYRNNLKNKNELDKILDNVKKELEENKKINDELIIYHQDVIDIIETTSGSDSALNNLKSDFGFKLYEIAPKGIMQKSVANSVWQTAKLNPLLNKAEFKKLHVIGKAYDQQEYVHNQKDVITGLMRDREMLSNEKTFENLLLLYNEIKELTLVEIELQYLYDIALKEIEVKDQ